MKRLALSLAIVFATAALALAAAKVGDSIVDSQTSQPANATPGQKVRAKTSLPPVSARDSAKDDAKDGDIIIRGKAGKVTKVDYGRDAKPGGD